MSISKRLRIIVTILSCLLIAMATLLLVYQWRPYHAARQAQDTFESFRSTLIVMEYASAERGPTNGALGEDLPIPQARLDGLNKARQLTDNALETLARQLAGGGCYPCRSQTLAVKMARGDLTAARQNIDRLLAMPRSQRTPEALTDAVNRMVDIIPLFIPVADTIGVEIIKADGDTLDALQMARLASILREQAGLLGSRFTATLTGQRPLLPYEQLAIERSYGRVEQLYWLIQSRAQENYAPAREALRRLKDLYMGEGLAYVAEVRAMTERAPAQPLPSTQQFADRYVPLMRPIVDFRNRMLDQVQSDLQQNSEQLRNRLIAITAATVALIGLLVLMLWMFRQRVLRPFNEATDEIMSIAAGNLTNGPRQHPYQGEIKALFDAVHTLKLHSLDRQHAINYASLIQRAVLPDRRMQGSLGQDYFVLWKPRDTVGGDFYLYSDIPQGGLLGLIDCAGHSVPGALMTMLARSSLNQAAAQSENQDPAGILMKTDEIMRNLFDAEHFNRSLATSMDAGLVRIDREARTLSYAGAKMSLFTCDGREVREYKGGRRSIGEKIRGVYTNTDLPLEAGWTYYLCTDGLLDQAGGEQGYGFGNKRFADLLLQLATLPLSEQATRADAALTAYQGSHGQRDDITLLAFRIA
jgi:serine phosphatase RsbU (regulator of sigma subunit)